VMPSAIGSDGQYDNEFVAILQKSPAFGFTTQQIGAALTLAGIDGVSLATSNVTLWLRRRAVGGLKASGAVNIKAVGSAGILYPTGLRASLFQPATLSYRAVMIDAAAAGTSGLAITASQADPAYDVTQELYTVGTFTFNATPVDGVQSVEIDFGIEVYTAGQDGLVFPTFVSIVRRRPVVRLTVADPAVQATISEGGTAIGTTAVVNLRGVTNKGIPGATGHGFTINDGVGYLSGIRGGDGSEQVSEVTIVPNYDGTNAPIAVASY